MTATGAAYDSQERDPPPRCQPGTRQALLEEITSWIEDGTGVTSGGSFMWLYGPAGAGKSAISQTICESTASRGRLAASFFFSRGHNLRGKINHFIATIAFQLANLGNDLLRNQILGTINMNPLILHEAAVTQAEHLIVRPLQSSFKGKGPPGPTARVVIVVDGLDECSGNDNQSELLNILVDLVRVHSLPLYVLVVSRTEPHIKHIVDTAVMKTDKCRTMSTYGDHQAHLDVRYFLRNGFEEIHNAERHSAIMKEVKKPWPPNPVIEQIVRTSGGYFIYPSAILKFVDEEDYSPIDRLRQVLDVSSAASKTAFTELDKLYAQILATSPERDVLKRILACILLPIDTRNPVWCQSPSTIGLQLDMDPGEVMLALRGLHSLLSFWSFPKGRAIRTAGLLYNTGTFFESAHPSLRDFLFDDKRAGTFFINIQEHHKGVAITCWRYFSGLSNAMNPAHTKAILLRDRFLELPYQTIPTTDYLLDSFNFHFTSILDKSQILDSLKGATWAPLIHASTTWRIRDKQMLAKTLHAVITELGILVPRPEELIHELTLLADSIHLNHLSPGSADDIRLIQGIWTLFSVSLDTEGYEEFLELSGGEPHWTYIVKYLTDGWDESRDNWAPFCKHPSFVEFMSDPKRCGNLFTTSETRHARLALCCIKELTSSTPRLRVSHSFTSSKDHVFDSPSAYAREHFVEHLSRAPPHEVDDVLSYLRTLDVDATSLELAQHDTRRIQENISTLLAWLEGLPKPPADIISPWKNFYQTTLQGSGTWSTLMWTIHKYVGSRMWTKP